ncbi:MAG TPA: hypothetical protein VLD64_01680 [Nitrosarchaeum sp.]|nr:hypothetical protein [Nitrosarchaeum sp.]
MGLFANKVLQYQQKKLVEAQNHLKSHQSNMEKLKIVGTEKEIANEEKMIKIWSANIEKIKKEINKLKDKK